MSATPNPQLRWPELSQWVGVRWHPLQGVECGSRGMAPSRQFGRPILDLRGRRHLSEEDQVGDLLEARPAGKFRERGAAVEQAAGTTVDLADRRVANFQTLEPSPVGLLGGGQAAADHVVPPSVKYPSSLPT